MKLAHKVEEYRTVCSAFLAPFGMASEEVLTGKDAWTVAHKSGITRDAYAIDRDITDGHIQTVLERIFPNAVFMDKKMY